MKTYLDCWIQVASSLLTQALAGEPEFQEALPKPITGETFGYTASLSGESAGEFAVVLEASILDAPLLGEGVDQRDGWVELLREIAEAAAGEMLAATGNACRVERFEPSGETAPVTRAFTLKAGERSWMLLVRDRVRAKAAKAAASSMKAQLPVETRSSTGETKEQGAISGLTPGLELLLDVELEASLRFGSRELPLGEILDLGPGDVVQLDRQVDESVDLIVADKIVARGEVVLVNGNFGLRITEVAAPRKRLESIRCLF